MPRPTEPSVVSVKPSDILRIDVEVWKHFRYLADPAGLDTWRSYADDVLRGASFLGDCDDLASTCLDLATREGAPLEKLYRLEVGAAGSKTVNHMLAAAEADDGAIYTFGDTFGRAMPASHFLHRGICYQRMDEWIVPGVKPLVRGGVPWAT